MPRTRRLSAEQIEQDRRAVSALSIIVESYAARYPQSVEIAMAVRGLADFGSGALPLGGAVRPRTPAAPKPATPAKPVPQVVQALVGAAVE